jgi:hypothetical protein
MLKRRQTYEMVIILLRGLHVASLGCYSRLVAATDAIWQAKETDRACKARRSLVVWLMGADNTQQEAERETREGARR